MPKITIDEIEYNTEDLTENGKAQLVSLQYVDNQIQKIRNEMAVYQTARLSYVALLKAEIEKLGIQPAVKVQKSLNDPTKNQTF